MNVWTIIVISLWCSIAWANPRADMLPLVVIDPGHGGDHHGAQGVTGLHEKDLVLSVSKKVAHLLQTTNTARVSLTRSTNRNLDLVKRVVFSNLRNADLLVSIHANASPRHTKWSGIEVYFLSIDASSSYASEVAQRENVIRSNRNAFASPYTDNLASILNDLTITAAHHSSKDLAISIYRNLLRTTKAKGRGVQQAPFVVLTGAKMPAVLVEVGFLDHPQEGKKLAQQNYQMKIALGLVRGIRSFLNQQQNQQLAQFQ